MRASIPLCLLGCVLALGCTALRPLDVGPDASTDAGGRVDGGGIDGGGVDAGGTDAGRADAGDTDSGCGASELCNGVDDDCDSATPDGADEPTLGAACDGPDDDLCEEGTRTCEAGGLTCSDATDSTPELCSGVGIDEDCDGAIDEADAADATAWYPDVDGDNYGDDSMVVMACLRPTAGRWINRGGDCDDTDGAIRPGRGESCDAIDNDCNGTIDDDGTCAGCDTRTFGGHVYLICARNETWDQARNQCQSDGYDLAIIDDAAENAFLAAEARRTGVGLGGFLGGWWIGLRMGAGPGSFDWWDGTMPTYTAWGPAEPNGTGPCARMIPTDETWADQVCSRNLVYFCESL